jgi:cytoskeleton protein RodZ
MRVKRSTLRALALVAPAEESAPPVTWKLMEKNGRRVRGKAASSDGSADIGTILRTTRRRRRISLDRAARETCIPRRHLEALERNEPASAFPGALYARGFLRAYARYLRFSDEHALLARFEPDSPAPIELPADVVPPPEATRRRRTRIMVLGVALAAAIATVATSGSSHPVRASFPAPLPTIATAPSTEPKEPAPIAVAATMPSITLEVAGGSSWVRVVADGATIFPGRTVAGAFTRLFTARRTLSIVAGNAAAVRISFDGEWRGPLGPAGQVVRIVVTLSDGVPILRITPQA